MTIPTCSGVALDVPHDPANRSGFDRFRYRRENQVSGFAPNRPRVLELNLNGTSEHLFVRHPVNLRHLFPLAVQEAKSKMPRKAAKLTEAPWYEE